MNRYDVGLIGLGPMGRNLVLNMERNGFSVSVYNRSRQKTDLFLDGPARGKAINPAYDLKCLCTSLKRPRVIMMMIAAGSAIDDLLKRLLPWLEPGDIVIDGGNSFFLDTERRCERLISEGIHFMGVGISGGEEGALFGASIMAGGPKEAYDAVEPVLRAISAKVNGDPCLAHTGPRGAGHYVKMVHNGIEYGEMQLIAEAYDLLHRGAGFSCEKLQHTFASWNGGKLASYLVEITADIFNRVDEETGRPLIDLILDKAEQKGTGRWVSQNALELGVPIPTIDAAISARAISGLKEERIQAAKSLARPRKPRYAGRDADLVKGLEDALYAARICCYAQGMALLQAASARYGYGIDRAEIARIWRGGCILRAPLLEDIRSSFEVDPGLSNLLVAPFFKEAVSCCQGPWREMVGKAAKWGIPAPALSASLAYFDSYRAERLPANLIQAQRDYFGAHTYRRIDREGTFHTEWKKGS